MSHIPNNCRFWVNPVTKMNQTHYKIFPKFWSFCERERLKISEKELKRPKHEKSKSVREDYKQKEIEFRKIVTYFKNENLYEKKTLLQQEKTQNILKIGQQTPIYLKNRWKLILQIYKRW